MSRRVLCCLTLMIAVLFLFCSCAEQPAEENINEVTLGGKKYSLVLSDEFDFWDTSIWARCPQVERQDAGGWWKNSCSKVEDGNLMITCDVDKEGTPISGAVRTRWTHDRTYGLYHFRFKMEKADGLWYAFWLLSDTMENDTTGGNGATDGAEMDILEVVPHSGDFEMSVHWDGYEEGNLKSYSKGIVVNDDFYDRYHEIWYLWDQDGYKLYLDGTDEKSLVFSFDGKNTGGTCAVPSYLIVSAEYGAWGGEIIKSQLPAHFYVDYVRIYSEEE